MIKWRHLVDKGSDAKFKDNLNSDEFCSMFIQLCCYFVGIIFKHSFLKFSKEH